MNDIQRNYLALQPGRYKRRRSEEMTSVVLEPHRESKDLPHPKIVSVNSEIV